MKYAESIDVMERLEIKQLAKKKAGKATIVLDIIFIIAMSIIFQDYFVEESATRIIVLVITIIIMTTLLSIIFMLGFQNKIQLIEIKKRREEYVHAYLSKEDDVEVIPIDGKSYKEFLQSKGNFYARIVSNDEVGIWFQEHNETEKSLLEKVHKSNFKSYWLVKQNICKK